MIYFHIITTLLINLQDYIYFLGKNSNEKITEGKRRDRSDYRTWFLIQEREQIISYKKKPSSKLPK